MTAKAQRRPRAGTPSRRAPSNGFRPRVGDLAVCPPHGVGQIVAVGPKEVSGTQEIYYSLQILGRAIRVMIPARRLADAGLRAIIRPAQVKLVFALLRRKRRLRYGANWAKRHREMLARLHSGSIFEAATVLRDLLLLRERKELSVAERKLVDKAGHLVVTELAHASRQTVTEVEAAITEIFGRGCLTPQCSPSDLAATAEHAGSSGRSAT